MKLSAPIYVLKSRAKTLKHTKSISMLKALDEVAQGEGYSSWSLLQSKSSDSIPKSKGEILSYLNPGDLMLLGSRPGLGKTRFALEMLFQAVEEERRAYLFSLEFTQSDLASQIEKLDVHINQDANLMLFDFSDEISSGYIIDVSKSTVAADSLIVIDYLQLLDQKRSNPELHLQLEALKTYAKEKKCIIVFLSQLDRFIESDIFKKHGQTQPGIEGIRMPNYFDIGLFNKIMLLHKEKILFLQPANFEVG